LTVVVTAVSDDLTKHQVVDVAKAPVNSLFLIVGHNQVHEAARAGGEHQVLSSDLIVSIRCL
jgi:hypothetical protein